MDKDVMTADFRIKRIYAPIDPTDGARILVDRLWPRGVQKETAALTLWLKEIAPSAALRRWFGHQPERWDEFRRRYREELGQNDEVVDRLAALSRTGRVTLLFAARDQERNDAAALAEYMRDRVVKITDGHGNHDHRADGRHGANHDDDSIEECNSPVCWARAAEDTDMGYASRDDLVAFLNELLEAERAGARVTLRSSSAAEDPRLKSLLATIHRDETKWCGVLTKALQAVNGTPSLRVGAFYDKAMAIEDLAARLAFLNRGQGWVVRKLRDMLPKIRDDGIHKDLMEMLASHERNIGLVEKQGSGDEARRPA